MKRTWIVVTLGFVAFLSSGSIAFAQDQAQIDLQSALQTDSQNNMAAAGIAPYCISSNTCPKPPRGPTLDLNKLLFGSLDAAPTVTPMVGRDMPEQSYPPSRHRQHRSRKHVARNTRTDVPQ